MKFKNLTCLSCANNDLVSLTHNSDPSKIGIYCPLCGKFIKWANKEEKNLIRIERRKYHDIRGNAEA